MATYLPRRSLSIDFAKDGQASGDNYPDELSKLDSLITFSRASVGTRYNISGAVEVIAAGQPRFDYDPTTHAPRGLLIEESRTNYLLNSGTPTSQTVSLTAGTYTLSSWGGNINAWIAPSNTVLLGTATATTPATFTIASTTSVFVEKLAGSSATRFQLENGACATSYIPTTSAAVTRAADSAVITTLAPWFNATAGTLLVESTTQTSGTVIAMAAAISDNSTANRHLIYHYNGLAFGETQASNVPQASLYAGTVGAGIARKVAYSYAANAFSAGIDGASVLTDLAGSVPASLIRLDLGSSHIGTQYLNGWIKRIAYQPYKVSDLLLKQLATV